MCRDLPLWAYTGEDVLDAWDMASVNAHGCAVVGAALPSNWSALGVIGAGQRRAIFGRLG